MAKPAQGKADQNRSLTGKRAYLSGLAAEDSVIRVYEAQGAVLRERRWRGEAGEIDLILEHGDDLVFCEVKQARTHDIAATSLRPRQRARIRLAAAEYLSGQPKGELTPSRLELALVDQSGTVRFCPEAFAEF